MTYPVNVTERIEEVRRQTVAVLGDLVQKADEFGLVEPPPVLEHYCRKLRENTGKVLVTGGTKRGKSTFVNALIGRDVLPTGVATNQVFNIRPSEREAYRLRFEDGSEREVSSEDIPLYDSRRMAGAIPTTDPIIRWVEVDAPVRFLPEGLSLLDTPGRIADRLVPEADGIIFVLESGQPITDDDLESIEEILDATPYIFFIQTKMDLYDNWRDVQRLNQTILGEKFEGRLIDTRVWPISSTNLRETAAGDGKELSLMVSLHRKLAVALRTFLAGVVGWNWIAEAMQVAVRFHTIGCEAFSGQLAAFAAESEQKRSEMQNIARWFEEDWSPQGRKRVELRKNLQRAIAVGKQSFANTLQMGGDIELVQKVRIDKIKSLTEANRVGKEMPDEVFAAAMNGWARVCEEVRHRCAELLGPLGSGAPPDPNMSGPAISNSGLDVKFKTDYFTMLRGAASGTILLAAASVAVATTGISLPPLGLVAVPVLLVLVGSGIRHARMNQLKAARQELRMHLVEVLQKVRRHFFDVDLMSGRFSRMDEYFSALEISVNEQVRETVEKKSKDVDAEMSRLAEAIKLDDRDLRTRQTREQLIEWDSIGKSARDIMALITKQAGDTVASINDSSLFPPVPQRLDATPPDSDKKIKTLRAANIRWPIKSGSGPSSPPPPSDPAPRYREPVEAARAEGMSDRAKWFDVFAGQAGLSGEQAADRRYAELKRRRDTRAISDKGSIAQHERLVVRLRWVILPAISAALAWGYWFVFVG